MKFDEVIVALRKSEIHEKVSFTHPSMAGYFVKEELGEFVYYDEHGTKDPSCNFFFLSDFDRDDWYIIGVE